MKDQNLKKIEKRTYISYHQDGLLDIFIGFYILLFAFGILLNSLTDYTMWFLVPSFFPAIMIPIWISIKKRVTMPRIGFVKFRTGGANKMTGIFIGLMVAGLGVFLVFTLFSTSQPWAVALRDILVSYSTIIIGVGSALISSLFAYTMGLNRLYGYGLFSLILFLIAFFIIIPFEYILLTIAITIVFYGFVLLKRFIQKYPISRSKNSIVKKTY
jgi:hypothetical protein